MEQYQLAPFLLLFFGSFLATLQMVWLLHDLRKELELARTGNEMAAKKLVLPCYKPLYRGLIWSFALSTLFVITQLTYEMTVNSIVYTLQFNSLYIMSIYAIMPILLIQKSGLSKQAFRTTAKIILSWLLVSLIIFISTMYSKGRDKYALEIVFAHISSFPPSFLVLGIVTKKISSRVQLKSKSHRASLEFLMVYSIVLYVSYLVCAVSFESDDIKGSIHAIYALAVVSFICDIFFPLSFYRTIVADTKYWRGIGKHNSGGMLSKSVGENFALSASIYKILNFVGLSSNENEDSESTQEVEFSSELSVRSIDSNWKESFRGPTGGNVPQKRAPLGRTNSSKRRSSNIGCIKLVPTMGLTVVSYEFQDMMSDISEVLIDFPYIDVGKTIGKGATAVIHEGRYYIDAENSYKQSRKGIKVAIKTFAPSEITKDLIDDFIKEAALNTKLNSIYVCKFYGICVRPPDVAVVLELCEHGNLKQYLKEHPKTFKNDVVCKLKLCLDAARSISYIHSQGYIHRDIKTENFLLSKDYTVKLSDFGESVHIYKDSHVTHSKKLSKMHKQSSFNHEDYKNNNSSDSAAKEIVGTVAYMSPELIEGDKYYSETIDIFALGITFWEIWTQSDVHANLKYFEIYEFTRSGKRPPIPPDMPAAFAEIVEECWHQDQYKRPTAKNIVKRLKKLVKDAMKEFQYKNDAKINRIVINVSDDEDDVLVANDGYESDATDDAAKISSVPQGKSRSIFQTFGLLGSKNSTPDRVAEKVDIIDPSVDYNWDKVVGSKDENLNSYTSYENPMLKMKL